MEVAFFHKCTDMYGGTQWCCTVRYYWLLFVTVFTIFEGNCCKTSKKVMLLFFLELHFSTL